MQDTDDGIPMLYHTDAAKQLARLEAEARRASDARRRASDRWAQAIAGFRDGRISRAAMDRARAKWLRAAVRADNAREALRLQQAGALPFVARDHIPSADEAC